MQKGAKPKPRTLAGLVRAGAGPPSGLIDYRRGHVTITDRAGLESFSCECYPLMKREFSMLVGGNGHAA